MGLIFRSEGHNRVARDDHWTYTITSYRREHALFIQRHDSDSDEHSKSMHTRRGAMQLAREFHKLGEDYDPDAHEGRSRFEQALDSTGDL